MTTILGRFTGIYSNYNLASAYDSNLSFDFSKMAFDSTNNLIPQVINNNLNISLIITQILFVMLLVLGLSLSTLGKIQLSETGSLKEALSIKTKFKRIKTVGIKQYIKFVALVFIILGVLFYMIRKFDDFSIVTEILQSFFESFFLMFSLKSFHLMFTKE